MVVSFVKWKLFFGGDAGAGGGVGYFSVFLLSFLNVHS